MNTSLRCAFTIMALMATLALALVPGAGRFWSDNEAATHQHGEVHPPLRISGISPGEGGHPAIHRDTLCAYCPLLKHVALPALLPTPDIAHVPSFEANDSARACARPGILTSRLGARGPPAAA